MFIVNENDFEYRFGDSGPKYLMKGPRMNFALVRFKPGEDFSAQEQTLPTTPALIVAPAGQGPWRYPLLPDSEME